VDGAEPWRLRCDNTSRTKENELIGLEKIREVGVSLTSTESVLFELLRVAKGLKFREIFKIVK
jgi:hypothetical protein